MAKLLDVRTARRCWRTVAARGFPGLCASTGCARLAAGPGCAGMIPDRAKTSDGDEAGAGRHGGHRGVGGPRRERVGRTEGPACQTGHVGAVGSVRRVDAAGLSFDRVDLLPPSPRRAPGLRVHRERPCLHEHRHLGSVPIRLMGMDRKGDLRELDGQLVLTPVPGAGAAPRGAGGNGGPQ